MFKLLLAWRYLCTRHIALASIVSVTLGVATLIVVNAVMAGFTAEMHKRLHGILSDVVVESYSAGGVPDPEFFMTQIRQELGDSVAGITAAVHVPAVLSYQVRGQWVQRELMVIGIDDATYAEVGDFRQYLLHPENRERLSFRLPEAGYDARLPESGWAYRRQRAAFERAYEEQRAAALESRQAAERQRYGDAEGLGAAARNNAAASGGPDFSQLPPPPAAVPPSEQRASDGAATGESGGTPAAAPAAPPRDPFQEHRAHFDTFDPAHDQHTGVILGMAIASVRQRDEAGEVRDYFLCRPGDDVKITLPTASVPPQGVSDNFTVVDLYESKMSEYDSKFAFVPLRRLQQLRGMIDPQSGISAVTSIQLKLAPGANLNEARDRLRQRFPADMYPFRILTWKDMQGPLLSAVQMETIILNLLLFLIIAVAGFGILATFYMIVVEKTRDVGVLKALGASHRGVMAIFLTYGLVLGLAGSAVGMIGGIAFVWYINDIADLWARISGHEVFDPTVYYFQEIPTILNPLTVAGVMVGAMTIAVMASVLPARHASRLHPVEALRYE